MAEVDADAESRVGYDGDLDGHDTRRRQLRQEAPQLVYGPRVVAGEEGEVGGGLGDGERNRVVRIKIEKMRRVRIRERKYEFSRKREEMRKRKRERVLERRKECLKEVMSGMREIVDENALNGRTQKPWNVEESQRNRG